MINYAHRGASAYAPENTRASFNLGIEMNANGIETDIRKTRDGVFVLFHDDNLSRIVGCSGNIEGYTYSELCKMDFGAFKGPQYKGERIVSLDDFLSDYGNRGLSLALEIKGQGIAEEVYKHIENADNLKYTITSFDYKDLQEVRAISDKPRLGYLTDCFSTEMVDRLIADGMNEICPKAEIITPGTCRYAHEKGLTIRAWGVVDYNLMVHCCLCKVDGMTVNFPDLLDGYIRHQI